VHGTIAALKLKLLGPVEYEVRFAAPLNGSQNAFQSESIFTAKNPFPSGGNLTRTGPDWLRYHADQPEEFNPRLLFSLLSQNIPVVSLHEVPRSLEAIYLQAVNSIGDEVLNVC